jgi:hypothetical protein
MSKVYLRSLVISFIMLSCNNESKQDDKKNEDMKPYKQGSFGYDLNFLQQHDSVVVLKAEGEDAQVIVSPKYQAKVFTSTAAGNDGESFGWINYKAFTAPVDSHMNAYGGENRLWLGPEGGIYSLFFKKGDSMVFNNWKTPAPIDTESWKVSIKNRRSVTMTKDIQLVNFAGTELQLSVVRTIAIIAKDAITRRLGLTLENSVKVVGYQTSNSLTNKGKQEWNEKTGMPCVWILDMFKPSAKTAIVLPYHTDVVDKGSKAATTDYFGEIPADRLKYNNGILLFKADGKKRGKLGLTPKRAKPMAGSFDAEKNILTITMFDVDPNGKYLNQEWNTTRPPFSGDAVNAYNDGPLEDGSQMGPFYEIESVSPAAFLQPGASLNHNHAVFHFTGNEQELDKIATKVLGISLEDIIKAF